MAKNEGKKFEEDFKNSVPATAYIYKLKDAGGWSNATNTRFTVNNICDYIMYSKPTMYLLELKSFKGKSLPYSNIKKNQTKGLLDASKYAGIRAGIVANFRGLNETYYIDIRELAKFKKSSNRKSYPLDLFQKKGQLIEQEKKVTRYKYDIEKFIKGVKNE